MPVRLGLSQDPNPLNRKLLETRFRDLFSADTVVIVHTYAEFDQAAKDHGLKGNDVAYLLGVTTEWTVAGIQALGIATGAKSA